MPFLTGSSSFVGAHYFLNCSHLRRFSVPNGRKLYLNNGARTVVSNLKTSEKVVRLPPSSRLALSSAAVRRGAFKKASLACVNYGAAIIAYHSWLVLLEKQKCGTHVRNETKKRRLFSRLFWCIIAQMSSLSLLLFL